MCCVIAADCDITAELAGALVISFEKNSVFIGKALSLREFLRSKKFRQFSEMFRNRFH